MRTRAAGLAVLGVLLAAVAARADELRNVEPGQLIPDFELPRLAGGTISSAELRGKPVVIVYVSAEQRRSEAAERAARAVQKRHADTGLATILVTADADRAEHFRRRRTATGAGEPMALDGDRSLYGALGLIVMPTTVVVDPAWRLAHVISSYKPDYERVLGAYVEHAAGRIDDAGLQERLATRSIDRDSAEARIDRHRAAAVAFAKARLVSGAEKELRAALAIDAVHVGARLDLAQLLIGADRAVEARPIIEAVVADDASSRRARMLLGMAHYHLGDLDEAHAALTEASLYNADRVVTHYYLGLVAEQRGDMEAAAMHFRTSLERALKERGRE